MSAAGEATGSDVEIIFIGVLAALFIALMALFHLPERVFWHRKLRTRKIERDRPSEE